MSPQKTPINPQQISSQKSQMNPQRNFQLEPFQRSKNPQIFRAKQNYPIENDHSAFHLDSEEYEDSNQYEDYNQIEDNSNYQSGDVDRDNNPSGEFDKDKNFDDNLDENFDDNRLSDVESQPGYVNGVIQDGDENYDNNHLDGVDYDANQPDDKDY